jgi:hypothetical protein
MSRVSTASYYFTCLLYKIIVAPEDCDESSEPEGRQNSDAHFGLTFVQT